MLTIGRNVALLEDTDTGADLRHGCPEHWQAGEHGFRCWHCGLQVVDADKLTAALINLARC